MLIGVLVLAGCSSEVGGTAAQQFTTAVRTEASAPPAPTSVSAQVTLSDPAATSTGGTDAGVTSEPASTTAAATTATAPTVPPTVTLPPSSTVTVVVTASSSTAVVTKTAQRPTVTATVTRTGAGAGHSWSQWQSPSGNISCLIADGEVRCDINEMDFTAPKPASCNGVPKAIVMATGGAPAFRCISDTVANPSNPVLQYGDSTQAGGFTCTSQEDGMHCSNGSGNSFRLARGSYDLN